MNFMLKTVCEFKHSKQWYSLWEEVQPICYCKSKTVQYLASYMISVCLLVRESNDV